MSRFTPGIVFVAVLLVTKASTGGNLVLEWNDATRQAARAETSQANPGWSSRAMAMVNGAMYDTLMAIDRTHEPFLADISSVGMASKEAAMSQSAYRILLHVYPGQSSIADAAYATQLAAIPDGPAKNAGIDLGNIIADQYLDWRNGDGADVMVPYTSSAEPGRWRPDPLNPGQQAWGPGWGTVTPFAMASGAQFQPPAPPELTSQQYADSFNEVKSLGAANSATRTAEQTEIGLFWAYDRPGMGPPPVLYNSMISQIAEQQGNTLEQDARMFAMSMIALADAGIAAWDSKFADDFWRPINAIREADTDGNPLTEADPDWTPMGAPGAGEVPDFTPPFPAYVSGHATFGAAAFAALAEFYGTDDINFTLTSDELPGVIREYESLQEAAAENGRARVYLGIHWDFDDEQGRILGEKIAQWVAANHFAEVPEPSSFFLFSTAAAGIIVSAAARRRRK